MGLGLLAACLVALSTHALLSSLLCRRLYSRLLRVEAMLGRLQGAAWGHGSLSKRRSDTVGCQGARVAFSGGTEAVERSVHSTTRVVRR